MPGQITVLGAGIGGLAAAMACAKAGARVVVLEQAPEISEVGAGLQISPNGVAVLQALGLGDALAKAGLRAEAAVLRDGVTGDQVARLPMDRGPRPYLLLHRADLIALLAKGARDAGIEIRLEAQVKTVSPGPQASAVALSDGTSHEAPILIGADGLHSPTRAALNPGLTPRFTGQVAWRAVIPGGDLPPVAQVFMGDGKHLVCYPLRNGALSNIVGIQERSDWTADGWHHTDNPENLQGVFSDFAPEVQALLAAVQQVALWGLHRHEVAPDLASGHHVPAWRCGPSNPAVSGPGGKYGAGRCLGSGPLSGRQRLGRAGRLPTPPPPALPAHRGRRQCQCAQLSPAAGPPAHRGAYGAKARLKSVAQPAAWPV